MIIDIAELIYTKIVVFLHLTVITVKILPFPWEKLPWQPQMQGQPIYDKQQTRYEKLRLDIGLNNKYGMEIFGRTSGQATYKV